MSEGSDGNKPTKGRIQAVLGAGHRSGRWYVADTTSVLAVFGTTVVDLRNAESAGTRLAFKCMSAFGSIVFVVTEESNVRTSGLAVLASQRSAIPASVAAAEGPTIDIDATTVLGKLHVLTEVPPTRSERRAAKKVNKAARKAPIPQQTQPQPVSEAPAQAVYEAAPRAIYEAAPRAVYEAAPRAIYEAPSERAESLADAMPETDDVEASDFEDQPVAAATSVDAGAADLIERLLD
jgi:hypothetical protein